MLVIPVIAISRRCLTFASSLSVLASAACLSCDCHLLLMLDVLLALLVC